MRGLGPGLQADHLHQMRQHPIRTLPAGDDLRGLQRRGEIEALPLMADRTTIARRRLFSDSSRGQKLSIFAVKPRYLGRRTPLLIRCPRASEIPARQSPLTI